MIGHLSSTPVTPKLWSASRLPGPVLGADGETDVPTLKESRRTVCIGCRDNVLWLECCDSGLILGFAGNLPVAYLAKWLLGGFKERKALQEGCGEGRHQRESQGRSTVGLLGFSFAFEWKSLKYFEQISDTIYAERLFWLLGRAGPSGAGVGCG